MIFAPLRYAPLLLLVASSAAPAQLQLPDLLGGQSSDGRSGGQSQGGLGSLLGGLLPNVGSVAAPNAAGVLGYCLKNKFLGGANATGAASVIGQLTGKQGTKTAPGYAEGRQGLLQMDGNSLSLGGLKGQVTTKLCDLVLKRAQSFL